MLCRNCGCSEYDHTHTTNNQILCPNGGSVWAEPFNDNNSAFITGLETCPGCKPGNKALHWPNCINNPINIKKWALAPTASAVNPKFHAALKKMAEIHDKKSADYATDKNRYSNFEEAAATAGVTVDDVFATLIGIKLARLKELLKSGKTPANESVQDTRLDLAVYSVLWLSYHEEN